MIASRVLGAVWCVLLTSALACAGSTPTGAGAMAAIRVVVVEGEKTIFAEELAARFGERLGAGEPGAIAPRLERMTARAAAARLKRGECEAVLFIGAERPGALRSAGASTLAALCGHVLRPTPVYLIVSGGNPDRKRALGEAFAAVVGEIPHRAPVAASE